MHSVFEIFKKNEESKAVQLHPNGWGVYNVFVCVWVGFVCLGFTISAQNLFEKIFLSFFFLFLKGGNYI
jgi:hypothetical protein